MLSKEADYSLTIGFPGPKSSRGDRKTGSRFDFLRGFRPGKSNQYQVSYDHRSYERHLNNCV